MVRGWWLAALCCIGCFDPRVVDGLPCSESGACPEGQMCGADGVCRRVPKGADGGSGADAAPAEDEILIPAGAFFMGCNAAVDSQCAYDEEPGRMVTLRAYYIDRREVTLSEYKACMDAGVCTTFPLVDDVASFPDDPVGAVTWMQAVTYCSWRGRRLPTEAEWEKAARGTDGRKYPWGNAPDPDCQHMVGPGCGPSTQPVGSHPMGQSPYGALDMLGNVWEWCADWYRDDYYASAPATDPPGPSGGAERVIRGGSYSDSPGVEHRTSARSAIPPEDNYGDLGFRCARDG